MLHRFALQRACRPTPIAGGFPSRLRTAPQVPSSSPVVSRAPFLCRVTPDRPDWVNDLIRDAEEDEDVAALLQGTSGNPELIRQKMRAAMAEQQRYIEEGTAGEDAPIHVEFREVDSFYLHIWFEFYQSPAEKEREMLDEVVRSWFTIGRLGGFNSMNLQIMFRGDDDLSYFKYDREDQTGELPSLFHEMGDLEYRGTWARFFVDMGTADEMSLDVFINMISNFSKEYVGVKQLLIGGENADWPIPARANALDDDVPLDVGLDPMTISRVGGGDEDEDAIPDDGFVVEDLERMRERAARRAGRAAAGPNLESDVQAQGAGAGSSARGTDAGGKGFGGAAAAQRRTESGGDGGEDGEGEAPVSSGKSTRRRR